MHKNQFSVHNAQEMDRQPGQFKLCPGNGGIYNAFYGPRGCAFILPTRQDHLEVDTCCYLLSSLSL
jgi:hypothetical protein